MGLISDPTGDLYFYANSLNYRPGGSVPSLIHGCTRVKHVNFVRLHGIHVLPSASFRRDNRLATGNDLSVGTVIGTLISANFGNCFHPSRNHVV